MDVRGWKRWSERLVPAEVSSRALWLRVRRGFFVYRIFEAIAFQFKRPRTHVTGAGVASGVLRCCAFADLKGPRYS